MTRISLCLIARDEEELLPGCLASVRGAVDEIVLVDTGSSDRTVELAQAAGARVFHQPWRDDFSAPRNLAAAEATGGFLLQLDADERLAPGGAKALRAAVKGARFDVGFLRLHNASRLDATPEEVLSGRARLSDPSLLPRLLRRTPDLRWTGVIHETVRDWFVARGSKGAHPDVDLIHLGGIPALRDGRRKKERNLHLLRRRVEQEPDDVTAFGYLAFELFTLGQLQEAAEVAERGFALVPAQPRSRPVRRLALVRGLLALALGEPARALESAEVARAREGEHADLSFLRGAGHELAALRSSGPPEERRALLAVAAESYAEAILLRQRPSHEIVLVALGPELPLRLGGVLAQLGRGAEALARFRAARAEGAGEAALLGEAEAALLIGDATGALRQLEPLLGARPDGWAVAARAALALGATADARLFLAQARARLGAGFLLQHLLPGLLETEAALR
jgi:tetratricopeptide (TPR) repeat protein